MQIFEEKDISDKKQKNLEYYAAHREKLIADAIRWQKENPERKKAADLAWRNRNKEKAKATTEEWQKKNSEKLKAYQQKWREDNQGKIKKWRQVNTDRMRSYRSNRRTLEKVTGKLSSDLTKRLIKLQRNKCACCGKSLGDNYHLDHIMPISLGGENIDTNMQLLRAQCNLQKRAKHPIDFMQSKGYLL